MSRKINEKLAYHKRSNYLCSSLYQYTYYEDTCFNNTLLFVNIHKLCFGTGFG